MTLCRYLYIIIMYLDNCLAFIHINNLLPCDSCVCIINK